MEYAISRLLSTDELYHHGIKGQKWGVRRFQKKDGSLTNTGRKRYADDATVIKKGTTFNRISTVDEKKANKDRTYLTYTDSDHDFYKENMTKYRKSQLGSNTKIYDISYINKKDIVLPSHEQQVSEFVNMCSNKKIKKLMASQIANENASRFLESTYGIKFSEESIKKTDLYKKLNDEFLSYDDKQLRDDGYNQFIKTYSDIPISKIYQKKLMKKGYNAIFDDNDIMNNTMDTIRPDKSIILFSGKKNLRNSGSKELTDDEYKQALRNNERRRKGR